MKDGLLSIILLSYYSENRIKDVFEKTKKKLEEEDINFEFIIIDDGSKDNSFNVAKELEKEDKRVRAYQLSRNYTTHYAKFAGFSVSKGDCVTSIPDDFQLPLDIVISMFRQWQKGHKLVVPCRRSRSDGIINDFFSNAYYAIMNRLADVNFPPGGADVFLADREIIDILNKSIHPRNTSTTMEVLRLGFDPLFLPYDRPKSYYGKSRWSFRKKIKLFKDTFLASSTFPIKFISWLGLIVFIFSLFFIAFYIYAKLSRRIEIPGWTSIIIIISFFSGCILLSLSIIAEYIWRIFEEVKERPGYIIKKNSFNNISAKEEKSKS
jgi:dolichol-phosphate mannosyltransferase